MSDMPLVRRDGSRVVYGRHIDEDAIKQEPIPQGKVKIIMTNTNQVIVNRIFFHDFILDSETLCAKSRFFKAAFQGKFKEGTTKFMDFGLDEIDVNIFHIFLVWLETGKLSAEGLAEKFLPGCGVTLGTGVRHDPAKPTKWDFKLLFDLYIFADKYDIPEFSQMVFEAIHIKWWRSRKGSPWTFISAQTMQKVCDNLLRSSPLRRFLADARVDQGAFLIQSEEIEREETEDLSRYPAEFLADVLHLSFRRSQAQICNWCSPTNSAQCVWHTPVEKLRLENSDWCHYHTHSSDEEERLCKVRKWYTTGMWSEV